MAGVKGRSGRKNRPPEVIGFRDFCRNVIANPKVQAGITRRALRDPEFALRVAEHGFGRPPQALDVKIGGDNGPLEFRILDAAGNPFTLGGAVPAAAVPLPGEAAE